MKRKSPYLVKPESKVRLADLSADSTGDLNHKAAAESLLKDHRKRLEALQELLYASQAKALLIVLQGMDTAGKDGTIRHIFSGINPQGCSVASFQSAHGAGERGTIFCGDASCRCLHGA